MRKTIQILLCIFAVVSLIVTGIAFYQIVLASTIHGAPVRFVNATAGPYSIKVAFYNDPINAGDAIPFNIAVAPGTQGPFTYQVTATPGPGVPGSLAQGDINTGQTQYGVSGSITFVTRGSWMLNIIINGPQGQGEAALPITAVAPPAMPAWLAWNIGLLPVYGLLVFWFVQVRRKSTDQPANTVPEENMSEDGRSVLHGSSS
jgi:hypothetical protein